MRDSHIVFVFIIGYIVMILTPGSSCKECGSPIGDDKMYSELVMILEPYCFVNECTIRINESRDLNIINNTGDWIIATNTTNLFALFANDSTADCSLDATGNSNQFDTSLYVIQNIIYIVTIFIIFANVVMHLMVQELRTVAGIFIIILCLSLGSVLILDFIHISLIYHQINIPEEICETYIYLNTIGINVYQAIKVCILAHFAYTMYRSYKLLGVQDNVRLQLCKYITFIIGASAISSSIIITFDALVNKKGFHTRNGQCVLFFDNPDRDGIELSIVDLMNFLIFLMWVLLKLILAIVGMILYFLTTRQCCITSTFRDFRVFIILTITVDLHIITFILLIVTQVSTFIFLLVLSISAAIEQIALFVFFASSSKVMCCRVQGRKCYSNCMDNACELTCTIHEQLLSVYAYGKY